MKLCSFPPLGRTVPKKLGWDEQAGISLLPPKAKQMAERRSPQERRAVIQPHLCLGKGWRPGDSVTWENQPIKVQMAHTCIPIALKSTAWARFSFMSQPGHQDASPELTDRITGPREASKEERLFGDTMKREEAAQGEPAKVSPWWRLLVKAALPAPCTPPHRTPPPWIATCPGPQGPHPSVARSRLGLWG